MERNITEACETWLWNYGWNDDAYILAALKTIPHRDLAAKVLMCMDIPEHKRGAVMDELARIQAALEPEDTWKQDDGYVICFGAPIQD